MQFRRPWFHSWVRQIPRRRDRLPTPVFLGFPGGSAGKESSCKCGRPGFDPCVGKIPWRRKWQPTPVFLPGESHGGAWWPTVHRVTKNWTWLKWLSTHHTCIFLIPIFNKSFFFSLQLSNTIFRLWKYWPVCECSSFTWNLVICVKVPLMEWPNFI